MSEVYSHTEPFAYILIVEGDDALRQSIPRSIGIPNCAVDVARDEDEAVYKALQHRPQLIIVSRHEPIEIDPLNPPRISVASKICRRARLFRSVRLVTHSDVSVSVPVPKVYMKVSNDELKIHSEIDPITNFEINEESPVILKPRFFLLRSVF